MMLHILRKWTVILLAFLWSFLGQVQGKELFSIGTQDDSGKEFDLPGKEYRNFLLSYGGENCNYLVGYSTSRNWPRVLPGPLDAWAGGGYWSGYHPRHFPSIWFQAKTGNVAGTCEFTIHFVAINKQDVLLKVEINGHLLEQRIQGDPQQDDALLHDSALQVRSPRKVVFSFPASWLVDGMNRIQLGSMEGSWGIFDSLDLQTPGGIELIPATTSTLVKSVTTAPFELIRDGARIQPLLVDLVQNGGDADIEVRVDGLPGISFLAEEGKSIREVPMPALKAGEKEQTVKVALLRDGKVISESTVMRRAAPLQEPCDYVDLLIGTGNSRWMFKPGPSLPFGMVQIAPDNQNEIWKGGYEYTIDNIAGFNHISDWTMTGFLMQPTTGPLLVTPGDEKDPDGGYRSRIDKKTEHARIGLYKVRMTDTGIDAEITATRHAAMQRYTFPASDSARVMVDMFTPQEYNGNMVDTKVWRKDDKTVEGYASYLTKGCGYTVEQKYTLWFVLEFNRSFDSMGSWVDENVPFCDYSPAGNRSHEFGTTPEIRQNVEQMQGKGDAGVFLNFKTRDGEQIIVRSGISLVDLDGARRNLETEISRPFGWDFDAVVKNARSVWNEMLSRLTISTTDHLQKVKFYTNLYRAIAAKATWSDADGRFVDEMERIRQLERKDDCIVSGEYWNTFWDVQQLFNFMAPEMSEKWARSAITLYENSGWFNTDPTGIEHTGVMCAMHMISQIQGAWQSGIRGFSLETAYEGLRKMMTTPPQKYEGGGTVGVEHLVPCMEYGYIPPGMGLVSNTFEYAYDDWCLAQMAKTLGKTKDYELFLKRSENWKNLFDIDLGFVRPKDAEGKWTEPFDPYHTGGFTEGNAFNYTWFVPQNPEELIRLMGRERFVQRLDEALEKSAKANFNASGDDFSSYPINHGNETSMEVTALFNYAGAPWLSQKWGRAIQEQYYGTTPYDAYPGDEDLGQMSSWFIMSALGFFQLDGGCSEDPVYEIISPRYEKVVVRFDSKYGRGEALTILADGASKKNCYIQSASFNGQPINSFKISASQLYKGGTLHLKMGDTPNKQWGVAR